MFQPNLKTTLLIRRVIFFRAGLGPREWDESYIAESGSLHALTRGLGMRGAQRLHSRALILAGHSAGAFVVLLQRQGNPSASQLHSDSANAGHKCKDKWLRCVGGSPPSLKQTSLRISLSSPVRRPAHQLADQPTNQASEEPPAFVASTTANSQCEPINKGNDSQLRCVNRDIILAPCREERHRRKSPHHS